MCFCDGIEKKLSKKEKKAQEDAEFAAMMAGIKKDQPAGAKEEEKKADAAVVGEGSAKNKKKKEKAKAKAAEAAKLAEAQK
jgi:hypothetical protein